MKLQNYSLETAIDFSQDAIWTLQCENPGLFTKLTGDFYRQTSKTGIGEWTLWENKPLDVSKYVYYVVDLHAISLSDKKATSIMQDHLKTLAFDADHTVQTHEVLAAVTKYFSDLTYDLDYPVIVDDAEFSQLLKAISVTFLDEATSFRERLMDFVTLLSRLTSIKVVTIVGLRSYLTTDEVVQFFTHCRQNGIYLVNIESYVKEITNEETVLTIDCDLCEFFQKPEN